MIPLRPFARLVLRLALLLAALAGGPSRLAAAPSPTVIRIGLSRRLFDSVNENDARAALKANSRSIGQASGFTIEMASSFIDGPAALRTALERGEIDVVGTPVDEFIQIPADLVHPQILVASSAGRSDDDYLLVAHRAAGHDRLAALAGGRIRVQHSVKAPLGLVWLDLLTRREHLGPADRFFASIEPLVKPSQNVLPVYFRQADAAVVTRRSFDLLAELNPGIARDLIVLASSPPLVGSLLCFRAGLPQATVDRLVAASRAMHAKVAGRQVLTLFQIERVEALPLSCTDTARALIAEHERLVAAPDSAPP